MKMSTTFFLFGLLAMASCSKQSRPMDENFYGNWKWIRTDGGIAYHIHSTPASTGKQVRLELRQDHQYVIYTNELISSRGTYTIDLRNCIHDHTDKQVIIFSEDGTVMIESVDASVLNLSDECYDGMGSQYARCQ